MSPRIALLPHAVAGNGDPWRHLCLPTVLEECSPRFWSSPIGSFRGRSDPRLMDSTQANPRAAVCAFHAIRVLALSVANSPLVRPAEHSILHCIASPQILSRL